MRDVRCDCACIVERITSASDCERVMLLITVISDGEVYPVVATKWLSLAAVSVIVVTYTGVLDIPIITPRPMQSPPAISSHRVWFEPVTIPISDSLICHQVVTSLTALPISQLRSNAEPIPSFYSPLQDFRRESAPFSCPCPRPVRGPPFTHR